MTRRTLQKTLAWLAALSVLAFAAVLIASPAETGGDPRPEGDDPKEEPTKPERAEKPAADPLADVKAVTRAAFKACLEPNESRGFNNYIDLIHPDQKEGDHAVDQIRRYSWKKFRSGCYQWLKDKKRLDFVVARTDPKKITKETDALKLFLKAQKAPKGGGPKRWDAPLHLKKDGSRWFIWRNSL